MGRKGLVTFKAKHHQSRISRHSVLSTPKFGMLMYWCANVLSTPNLMGDKGLVTFKPNIISLAFPVH